MFVCGRGSSFISWLTTHTIGSVAVMVAEPIQFGGDAPQGSIGRLVDQLSCASGNICVDCRGANTSTCVSNGQVGGGCAEVLAGDAGVVAVVALHHDRGAHFFATTGKAGVGSGTVGAGGG